MSGKVLNIVLFYLLSGVSFIDVNVFIVTYIFLSVLSVFSSLPPHPRFVGRGAWLPAGGNDNCQIVTLILLTRL